MFSIFHLFSVHTGSHLDSISVKKRSNVEVDIAQQTSQGILLVYSIKNASHQFLILVLATIKATKSKNKAQNDKEHIHQGKCTSACACIDKS